MWIIIHFSLELYILPQNVFIILGSRENIVTQYYPVKIIKFTQESMVQLSEPFNLLT